MQQVLWNLFFNAVKFTPRGGRVTIWTGRVETHVHLTVTDTGQGIGAPFLAHVFERFRQEDGQPSHTQAGLGLGPHAGSRAGRAPRGHGQGARVRAKATARPSPSSSPSPPCCCEPPTEHRPRTEGPRGTGRAPTSTTSVWTGLSVLVVDDDADVRDALAGVLERCGAKVRAAAGTREGHDRGPGVRPRRVGQRPRHAGRRRLRADPRRCGCSLPAGGGTLPALAVSAYARESDLRKALAAGFRVHLAKPVAAAELVQ